MLHTVTLCISHASANCDAFKWTTWLFENVEFAPETGDPVETEAVLEFGDELVALLGVLVVLFRAVNADAAVLEDVVADEELAGLAVVDRALGPGR